MIRLLVFEGKGAFSSSFVSSLRKGAQKTRRAGKLGFPAPMTSFQLKGRRLTPTCLERCPYRMFFRMMDLVCVISSKVLITPSVPMPEYL